MDKQKDNHDVVPSGKTERKKEGQKKERREIKEKKREKMHERKENIM